jgi:glycerophosphoryl diester phosphodiesterase
MQIIAHRGASNLAPENTLASINLAWEISADAVEIDVHLSKDGRIMVSHDGTTGRTGDKDLVIKETTSDELRKVDVGRRKAERFAGEKIPFFEEVLTTVPAGKRLLVEIKCGVEILPAFKSIVTASGKLAQIDVIGFDLEVMTAFKQSIPQLPVYWLRGTGKDPASGNWISHSPEIIEIAAGRGLDGLDLHFAGVTQSFADDIRAADQKLYIWTVNDLNEVKRLVVIGVDGITTDKPELLLEHLRQDMTGEK